MRTTTRRGLVGAVRVIILESSRLSLDDDGMKISLRRRAAAPRMPRSWGEVHITWLAGLSMKMHLESLCSRVLT